MASKNINLYNRRLECTSPREHAVVVTAYGFEREDERENLRAIIVELERGDYKRFDIDINFRSV